MITTWESKMAQTYDHFRSCLGPLAVGFVKGTNLQSGNLKAVLKCFSLAAV